MEREDLDWYHNEILFQCGLAMQAGNDLYGWIRAAEQEFPNVYPPYRKHGLRIWNCVIMIFLATGNISKMLWPGPKSSKFVKKRAAELRADLEIQDSDLCSRDFR